MSKRFTIEEETYERFSINLPSELSIILDTNKINLNDVNFHHMINNMVDIAIELILSNGDVYLENRIRNIISGSCLVTKENLAIELLDNEENYNIIKNTIYSIMESLLEKNKNYVDLLYVTETVICNVIVIVGRKK